MKTVRVAAAIIHDKGRIFATQRGYGAFKDGWEFPGGKIEPGETPGEANKGRSGRNWTQIEVGSALMWWSMTIRIFILLWTVSCAESFRGSDIEGA